MSDEHELAALGGRWIVTDTNLDELVLPAESRQRLDWVADWLKQPPFIFREWGLSRYVDGGLRVLFRGPGGTGKTMAAIALGKWAARPLLHIDLNAVVSKYIGETEKNLRRLFDMAGEEGAILLFDEADALFGKRSEVRQAHDRYAASEIAYLLRRIEAYEGLAILTSNLASDIGDDALRRIDIIVEFPRPDEEAREQLWRSLLGSVKLPQGGDHDFRLLAREYDLTGAEILLCVRLAASLAASAGRNLDMDLLQLAAKERVAMRNAAKADCVD